MLTKDGKRQLYERSWDLIDQTIRLLTPVNVEDDLTDMMGRLEGLKSMIEEKTAVLQEFDPN